MYGVCTTVAARTALRTSTGGKLSDWLACPAAVAISSPVVVVQCLTCPCRGLSPALCLSCLSAPLLLLCLSPLLFFLRNGKKTTVQSDGTQRGNRAVGRAARLPHPVHLDTRDYRRGHRSQREASSRTHRRSAFRFDVFFFPFVPGSDNLTPPASLGTTYPRLSEASDWFCGALWCLGVVALATFGCVMTGHRMFVALFFRTLRIAFWTRVRACSTSCLALPFCRDVTVGLLVRAVSTSRLERLQSVAKLYSVHTCGVYCYRSGFALDEGLLLQFLSPPIAD